MRKLTISMAIFNSYVKLPEGIHFEWVNTTNGPLSIDMLVFLMGKSFSIFTDIGIIYSLVNVYRLRTG